MKKPRPSRSKLARALRLKVGDIVSVIGERGCLLLERWRYSEAVGFPLKEPVWLALDLSTGKQMLLVPTRRGCSWKKL